MSRVAHTKKCLYLRHICENKWNRSGTISVGVVIKQDGRYKEIKSFDTYADDDVIESLRRKAKRWSDECSGRRLIDFDDRCGCECK